MQPSRVTYLENLKHLEQWLVEKNIYTMFDFKLHNNSSDTTWFHFNYDKTTLQTVLDKLNSTEAIMQQQDYMNGTTWIEHFMWDKNSAYIMTLERAKKIHAKHIYRNITCREELFGKENIINYEACIMLYKIINNLTCMSRPNSQKKQAKNPQCQFIADFMNIIHGNIPKVNSLMIYGASNAGKTQLLSMLLSCLNTAHMTNVGDAGTFHFSNIKDETTVIIGNETVIRAQTIEQWKAITGGEPATIPMKYKEHGTIKYRKPTFLTNQHDPQRS